MLPILLKSSACLAVFMLFYKFCLEKTSAHTFKRFYLIAVILISIGIPFIVFTEYVEARPETLTISEVLDNTQTINTEESKSFQDYTPNIFWSIYILGVLLFSFRFFKNLYQIFHKIKANPKYKNQNYINVLLNDLVHPHTFFNYIFLNKNKYERNLIPKEVLLHEQTHANQKHAIDILFIEVLQIAFWFNPLLYFIKKDIKLNHEFLADQAVINKGVNTKHYQQLLLAFSSNVSQNPLANAINYSLIKKRFTVMKTKTSKIAFWLRSLIILPLLAILIYGFSSKNIIEKQLENSVTDQESILENNQTSPLKVNQLKEIAQRSTGTTIISIIDNKTIALYNKKYSLKNFEKEIVNLANNLSAKEKEKFSPIIVHSSPSDNQTLKKVKNILKKYNLLKDYSDSKTVINFSQEKNMFVISQQQKATPKQLSEYNTLAKKYNTQPDNKPIIKLKDVKRLEHLYGLMSKKQKANAEPFPNFPPPPPALMVKKGDISNIPPPPAPPKVKKGEVSDIPPPHPPAPKTPLDHVIDMAKKDAIFYYNSKKIASDKAIDLLKNNKDLNISTKTKNGISVVKIQTEPITF